MSNLRHLNILMQRIVSRVKTNDNVSHLPKLYRRYSVAVPPEPPLERPEPIESSGVYESLPIVINRKLKDMGNVNPNVTPIREVWVENMTGIESTKLAIASLHPSVWGEFPRTDIIQENHKWQTLYKHIDWLWMPTRKELPGSNRKPWPQKGTGRARAKGIRAPQWIAGGWMNGPRGPKTHFYMLAFPKRVKGLISMLSSKLAQDDLKVVDSFDGLPSDKPEFIEKLCNERGWGPSVLFVDTTDIFPRNISIATNSINHMNLMPVYGLNVYSMLKHETLVLTLSAVEDIESKLLFSLRRTDLNDVMKRIQPKNPISL